ncbi:HAD superfamily hydrolase (TIGR01509 family) [Yoonia maricola]|uniref:HAD superfamily hydrolase (TIGR01509 family) n=1 Tax=Yoonia maricola TaxID=420999 RepID=A0A2M8W0L3_9RHOB|nr:HAD-IA family hydrolase [Yoonia maricola]PJI84456.1 HAD superfamily hydrolase (TIGR01509 family) [Yoonia maricola]
MTKKAIIFGSIGTIVETSELQHNAFNRAFEEANIDWNWSRDDYRDMLKNPGGRQRISDYAEKMGVEVNAHDLHARKTAIFDDMMVNEGLTPRPGVLHLIQFAKDSGMKVGFATTTSRNNVQAIFIALNNCLQRSAFDFVGDDESVVATKPDPEIYYRTMTALGVSAAQSLAIEDTGVSMQAALAAGLECIAFPGAYADQDAFDGALRIVDSVEPHVLPFLGAA